MIEFTVDYGEGNFESALFNLRNIVLILPSKKGRRDKTLIQYNINGIMKEWTLKDSYEEIKEKLGIK